MGSPEIWKHSAAPPTPFVVSIQGSTLHCLAPHSALTRTGVTDGHLDLDPHAGSGTRWGCSGREWEGAEFVNKVLEEEQEMRKGS